MKVTGAGLRPRSLGVRTPYSALSGTQRTRQRKARASQYIISNAETLQPKFTLFATVLPLVAPAASLGESLGVRGPLSQIAFCRRSTAWLVMPSPICPDRPAFREPLHGNCPRAR